MTHHFRYRQPPAIEADCLIEGPGVFIEATGNYCTVTGALMSLWVVETHPHRRIVHIDIDALARALVPVTGDDWLQLSDDKLADLLEADAENAACDWADFQNDKRRDDAA
jgi:hypothetical protein